MKCPKCSRVATYKLSETFIPIPGGYTQRPGDELKIEKVDCPHCDGTGEIQEGDVWKCRALVDGFYAYLFYNNPGWKYNRFTSSVIRERLVEPICRMVEVK